MPAHLKTGAYVLLLRVRKSTTVQVGALGLMEFTAGWYAYVGSAMGRTATSLYHRVTRHFDHSDQKGRRWHVDYLLAAPECHLEAVIAIVSGTRLECTLAHRISTQFGVPWGGRFGASDCHSCPSHLFFLGTLNAGQPPCDSIRNFLEIQELGIRDEAILCITGEDQLGQLR